MNVPPPTTRLLRRAVFVAVLLIAFFFRFYRLADHPLGIFFDPAINGLDAVRLMQRGGPVLFFPTNGGREAFFMYLLIPFIWLFDTTPLSLRALTATLSLLNVALLTGFLYRLPEPLPGLARPRYRFWLAGLGGLALAVSYWHIAISRLGQRPILVPMLAVPLFWCFLKGWTGGQKRWFLLAGLFMGLEGHTYSAARLLPLILGLALLPEFLRPAHLPHKKKLPLNLLIFGLAALAIYAPLAWYLLQHPAQFTARASSVMVWHFLETPAAILAEIGRNVGRVATFFCCRGSPNPLFGWPGYPGSSPLVLPFLLLGLTGALAHRRSLFARLVLWWWVIGVVPSVLAIEAPHPLRMIVAVVPTAILIALGFLHLWRWLEARSRPPAARPWLPWLACLIILAPTPHLFRAYFGQWTRLQATRGAYDYEAVALRDEILSHAGANTPLYLPLERFNDSTLLFYLSGSFRRQAALAAVPAQEALVIAPEEQAQATSWVRLYNHTATILPPLAGEGQQLIQAALAGPAARPIRAAGGEVAAHLAPLPTDPARFLQRPSHPAQATFGPLQLTGLAYDWTLDQGAEYLPVTLYWQANRATGAEYEVLLRLVDDRRRAWGNGDARPNDWAYPTSFWRPGLDTIPDHHRLSLEPGLLPPGRYWLAVSVFDVAAQRRLPLAQTGGSAPDTLFAGPLKVPLPPPESITAEEPPLATFGDVARLAAFSPEQSTSAPGGSLEMSLLWQSLATPDRDYTVFVHLLAEDDTLLAGSDSQPLAGRYPTTIWSAGEYIPDRRTLPLPPDLAPGSYRLAIGLYHQPSGHRLPVYLPGGEQAAQDRLILPQPVRVQ